MSRRCTSLAGDPSSGHRGIKILRFRGPPILGPCKGGVLRPVRHAQRIAPPKAKRHILADRWHLGIIRAKPLKSIIILGAPVCKAFQRPELALISLIDHVITPLLAQRSAAPLGLLLACEMLPVILSPLSNSTTYKLLMHMLIPSCCVIAPLQIQ